MDDLKIIIDSLGDQNEEIEDNDLVDIEEEIDSVDEEEYFELAKIAIKLGKPQILEYLIKHYDFDQNEIKELYEAIKKYYRTQKKQSGDSDEDDDIDDIMDDYKSIINNRRKLPYRKNNQTKNSIKIN
jgi:hypothetical protein